MNSDLALLYLLDELLLLSLWFLAYPTLVAWFPLYLANAWIIALTRLFPTNRLFPRSPQENLQYLGSHLVQGIILAPHSTQGSFAFWVVNEPVPKLHVPTSCLGLTVMPTATASLLAFPGVETKMGSGVQKKGRGEETGVSWGESADHDANLIPVRRVQERRRFRRNFRPKNGSYKVSARLRRMAEKRQSVRRALCWLPLLC